MFTGVKIPAIHKDTMFFFMKIVVRNFLVAVLINRVCRVSECK